MKKKLLASALTMAMLGSCMIAVPAQAENLFKWGDVTYDLDTGTVTKCETTASGSVSIPAKIKGTAVTSIATNAFNDCSGITSIAIPNSVTSIGDDAFHGCTGLNAVHITDIDAWYGISFDSYYANPLCYAHDLYLNNDLITELVIPNSVTSIGNYAFSGCTGLTSVMIPNSVTSIGNYAFSGCTGLTSINIPNNVTSIGNSAFNSCTGLKSVTIPDSVTSINQSAFSGCMGLTSVTIGNSVTSIGNYAFSGCKGLTSVNISDSVKNIGSFAFVYCNRLASLTIGNSVTSIGAHAFRQCYGLTSVTIPDSVTYIDYNSFSDCRNLESAYYNGTAAQLRAVQEASGWSGNYLGSAKIYVLSTTETKTATAYSTDTYTDNTANDGGATGFKAELPADSTSYKLGNVTWQVMSGNDIKSTAALSYGEMTVTSSPVIIGLVITGLYDPDAMALANYEKTNETTSSGYIEYIE